MELRDRLQTTLGTAYSIERELGGGGMSRVFLARETALGRHVVVKVLEGDALAGLSSERFAREVRLAASLQHPNIVPVLTSGVADGIPYYTMPYVKGESLRSRIQQTGALPRSQAVSILRDLARALQYAHGEGIIHRDIKPENVLLSGDAAVVTDFGIAKAISVARTSGHTDSQSEMTLTQAGSAIGTPAYMAPEQVAGDSVDHRVDLYAWGLLAYELLAGTHPFAGKRSAAQLLTAHLAVTPTHLGERTSEIPPPLADLVMRCLEKSPDERPASAAELVEILDAPSQSRDRTSIVPARQGRRTTVILSLIVVTLLAGAGYLYSRRSAKVEASAAKNSVAVLPFADARVDSADAYFGEGIADELMTALGQVPGLRVASRTSAIAVARRQDLDVREIGRQLGVGTVVEGTVRRSNGQLRVTAQLTNASDGLTLWSDVYQREDKDVFAVQGDITQAIVAALRPELTAGSRLLAQRASTGPGTSSPEAYDLYLRGLYLVERRGAGVARAAEYFSQAIQKDGNFARAHAGLAGALALFPYFAGVPAHRVEARLRAAAERSLQLDPALAEPRVALAMAHWHALRWTEAEAEFKQGIAADSNSPVAHTQYGRFLMSIARVRDALGEFRTARSLDPLAGTASVWLSHALSNAGEHAAAWEESKRARELDPSLATAQSFLAFDRIAIGRLDEARAIAGDNNPRVPWNGMRAYILHMTGDTSGAAVIRRTLEATPDTTWLIHVARAYAYLATGDTARLFTELEASLDRREILAQSMQFGDRIFDPFRQSPRFAAVVRRAGLEGRGLTGPTGGRPSK